MKNAYHRILATLFAILLIFPIAACGGGDDWGSSDQERCATAPNPTECFQVANAGGDIGKYLAGGLAGYMLSSVMSGGQRQTVIMPDPNYHGPRRYEPSFASSRSRVLSGSVRKVEYTHKRGLLGGTKTTRKVTSYDSYGNKSVVKSTRRSGGWGSGSSSRRRRK